VLCVGRWRKTAGIGGGLQLFGCLIRG